MWGFICLIALCACIIFGTHSFLKWHSKNMREANLGGPDTTRALTKEEQEFFDSYERERKKYNF
jgi:hypothetical protein